MKKKMTMVTLLAVAAVAVVAHGEILLDGGSSVSGSLIGANGALDLRGGYTLLDGGSAVPLGIGETFNMDFTFQALAVGTTTNGTKIGAGGTGWDSIKSLKLGFGDGVQALALQFELMDYNPKVALGGDSDATDETNFKFESGSGEFIPSGVQDTQDALRYAGDTATFNLSVDHTAPQTFDMTLTWGAYTANYEYTSVAATDILSISEFYVVMNNLDADLGYEVTVIPEPATLGLLGLGGIAVLAIRRFKA